MNYQKELIELFSRYKLTHSVTTHIDYKYSYRRCDEFMSYFMKDLTIFKHQLNRRFYGRNTSKSNYQRELPIIIPTIENLNSKFEPLHFHFSLGNLKTDIYSEEEIEEKIVKSWKSVVFCEKNNKSVVVKPIYSQEDWIKYMTKETNNKTQSCVQYDLIQTSPKTIRL